MAYRDKFSALMLASAVPLALVLSGCAHRAGSEAASTACADADAPRRYILYSPPPCPAAEPEVIAFADAAASGEVVADPAEPGAAQAGVPADRPAARPSAAASRPIDIDLPANGNMQEIASRVADHPAVLAAREREDASAAEVKKAKAAFFPTLSLEGSKGIEDSIQGGTNADGRNPYSYGVKAQLTVFDGFQRRHELQRARAEKDAAAAGTRDTVQQTLVDAVTLLAQSTRDKAVLRHRQDYLQRLGSVLRETRARKREGDASDTDVQQVLTRMEAAKASLSLAESARADTDAQLRSYLSDLKMSGLQLRDLVNRLPSSLEAARREALAQNPLLIRASMQADAAEEQRRAAQGAMMPRLNLVGQVEGTGEQYKDDKHGTDVQVGLEVSVPVFAGGAKNADLSQKRHEERAARYEVDLARRQVVAGVEGAWSRLKETEAALGHSEARIGAARKALKGVKASRDVDESSTLDVLNAHEELMSAEIEHEEFLHTRVVARHLLLAQVGRLDAAYGLRASAAR
ncbi:MAG: TolC family protein [Hyphomicrobiales bacterium]